VLFFKGFIPKCLPSQITRTICQITICVLIMTSVAFSVDHKSIPPNISHNAKPSSLIPADLPDKLVGNNRFVVGISFGGTDFKRIYPYFSVNIQNAHNPSFHPMENHHLYSGLLLLSLGKITHKRFLKTMGAMLIVDDLIEHGFNVKSALHFTANEIEPSAYAKLTKSADSIFK
jgi:hypothetical protein